MELAGIPRENFPPIVGNDSKTLRKLSLLEARMIGAGNESRDGSLPPNESSRGSDNNSNSMSTIGFAKPRVNVGSPGDVGGQNNSRGLGGGGGSRPKADPVREDAGGGGKRKVSGDGGYSPPRHAPPSQNAGTPSTLSTSPGESRDWSNARHPAQGGGEDSSGLKRARTGRMLQPPPPPPPSRLSFPQSDVDRQALQGLGAGAGAEAGAAKGQQGHSLRTSQYAEGGGSPAAAAADPCHSSERPSQGRDQALGSKEPQGSHVRASSDALAGGDGALPPPPPVLNVAQSADLSPPGGGRSGKGAGGTANGAGGGQAGVGGTTKTIQSYFFTPSNGSVVQALAACYGGGDAAGHAGAVSVLPREVDLSGADGDSLHVEPGKGQPVARLARSGSTGGQGIGGQGVRGGGGGSDGGSPRHRPSHPVSTLGEHGPCQGQRGQWQPQSRAQETVLAGGGVGGGTGREETQVGHESMEQLSMRLREAEALAARLRKELDRANLERGSMESMANTLQKQLDRKIEEFKTKEADRDAKKKQLTSVVEDLLRKVSAQEASDCRAKLARDTLELGKIVSVKTGHIGKYVEAFEDGLSFKDAERKTADVVSRRSRLEARRRAVSKLLKASASANGDEGSNGQARLEAIEEEETVRMHLTALKREEVAQLEEKRALDARKVLHIRELKRVAHEDRSKFSKRPTLSGRYVLLNLLGKGGFSEVWRAFDLVHSQDVAVKVHQLLNNWSEPQKANFIRHVTREYEIHQQMRHPRIVNLTDVFEICCDSFATVLGYCRGTDLECLLRERKQLPERDARALVLQVARGLQYLNTAQGEGANRRGAIIHYDLKPGNILLDENGDVKITDFGLSKILEIKKDTERGLGGGTSMELTSKGAGTYWYLPPECFGDNPRISSKVDVWSLGVVFFQMLYGVRPFGEGLSQEKILREKVIVNANRVEFPSKPAVSEEAKSFIRSCLTYTYATRPDVHTMCNLPYLTTPAPKRGA